MVSNIKRFPLHRGDGQVWRWQVNDVPISLGPGTVLTAAEELTAIYRSFASGWMVEKKRGDGYAVAMRAMSVITLRISPSASTKAIITQIAGWVQRRNAGGAATVANGGFLVDRGLSAIKAIRAA